MWFFRSKPRHSRSDVIKILFFGSVNFSLANNDTDISKTHLNKEEQIIKVDFYLHLQNTKNFALSASSPLFWFALVYVSTLFMLYFICCSVFSRYFPITLTIVCVFTTLRYFHLFTLFFWLHVYMVCFFPATPFTICSFFILSSLHVAYVFHVLVFSCFTFFIF